MCTHHPVLSTHHFLDLVSCLRVDLQPPLLQLEVDGLVLGVEAVLQVQPSGRPSNGGGSIIAQDLGQSKQELGLRGEDG